MEAKLGIQEIKNYLPHRYPFLLIDRVIELSPGKSAKGLKNVSATEHFFQGHFPDNPIMPGVLQIEALAQLAAICGFSANDPDNPLKNCVLTGIEKARFRESVVPGDQLQLTCELTKQKGMFWWFQVESTVEGKTCVSATLSAKMF